MSTTPDLLFDTPAPHVARITLHRPEARNALRSKLLTELAGALQIADSDPEVRCVILTGGAKVFAAGADVRELNETPFEELQESRRPAWQAVREFSKPLIAAVNGFCLGGGNELAMLCDVVVAGDDAKFGQPEIKLGLIPGAGGTQRLTAALGKARAMKFVLTGELITAQEAFVAGLVSELVPGAEVEARAIELARTIAAKSPLALRHAKAAVRHAAEASLAGGLALERQAFAEVFDSEDRREGIAAFLAKRVPNFTGR
jgi:enoyl-CoA hydratase